MALFLVQHGKSLPKEQDPEQGLSPAGIAAVRQVANLAKAQGLHVTMIQHSGKKRAQQTAALLTALLNPPQGVQARQGLNPLDEVSVVANQLDQRDDLMLVGHLPFMERMAAYLTIGVSDKLIIKFQNAGIVCLDKTVNHDNWFIKWVLVPDLHV